jgi:hypothetical protein
MLKVPLFDFEEGVIDEPTKVFNGFHQPRFTNQKPKDEGIICCFCMFEYYCTRRLHCTTTQHSTRTQTRINYSNHSNFFQNLQMSDESALAPLRKTNESIQQIKETLTPFLNLLDKYNNQEQEVNKNANEFDKQEIVEAEAAVALAMGTLRYMAHRLKGEERGKTKNDPLRMELDRMRKTLVQVKALGKKVEAKESIGGNENFSSKRKRINENAEKRRKK